MYFKLKIFSLFILFSAFFTYEMSDNIYNLFYRNIKNENINFNSFFKNSQFQKGGIDYIIGNISLFIVEHTNVLKAQRSQDYLNCIRSLNETTGDFVNYLGMIAFSGKGVSDLGLEEECLRNNYTYNLLTYDYINGSYVTISDQTHAFLFLQQNTFYTGLCFPNNCSRLLNFIFNETLNDIFYDYIKQNLNIQNAKIYDIGKRNVTRPEPYETYEQDGKYNYTKTKSEKRKFDLFNILKRIVYSVLIIQFVVSLVIHIFYKPYIKTKELRNEIDDNDSSFEPEEEDNESKPIFNLEKETKEKDEKRKSIFEGVGEFIYNYMSMFNNIKILLKKKNLYYNSNNLEIISFLRIFCMILITFINNFEVLIKIPSKDFFYEDFYRKKTFIMLKFTSFSVDMWICLDGFETMYKLINYYKKYVFKENKASMSFTNLVQFYFCSFYKLISFYIFFFLTNYFIKYFIYNKSDNAIFEYYSNHIYNNQLDNHELFVFLIPGYSFYYSYYKNISIFEKSIISKFSLLIINEFQIYIIFLLIFYISNLLKSKIFDYLVLIFNIILYSLNFLICKFKSEENTYYSYKLVLDNYLTIRYPHIIFNYFFFGALAGLTCFYFKDSFSNNSLSIDNDKAPFRFCYHLVKFFDYLVQNGRYFWIVLILILQLVICSSFNIFVKYNSNSIYILFNTAQKIVLCYETGPFILLFCILVIFMFFIKNEIVNKDNNYSSLIFLIERTQFSYLMCIKMILYSYYCVFNFQLKLNYQNLWIITFGIFFILCLENLILTLAFIFLFKMINKKIIKYFLSSEEKVERPSKAEELFDKSRESNTTKNE